MKRSQQESCDLFGHMTVLDELEAPQNMFINAVNYRCWRVRPEEETRSILDSN